jgi:uncharacterized membrane protein
MAAITCALLGVILLLISVYVLAVEWSFFHRATVVDATIIDVRHKYVAAGRGSILAYVPVVEIPATGDQLEVKTASGENVYSVGSKMNVLCDLNMSKTCIRNNFFDVWWGVVDLGLSLLLLAPSSIYLSRQFDRTE